MLIDWTPREAILSRNPVNLQCARNIWVQSKRSLYEAQCYGEKKKSLRPLFHPMYVQFKNLNNCVQNRPSLHNRDYFITTDFTCLSSFLEVCFLVEVHSNELLIKEFWWDWPHLLTWFLDFQFNSSIRCCTSGFNASSSLREFNNFYTKNYHNFKCNVISLCLLRF